ncbi:MAG: RluA family pseudouridine synthase [Lewinellaceae bacterium]|nr:RluA family pseudouridine synthase [Saprospiraceae bacterium]MCB9341864.1 RluA family pseudouridine synthase [Lewinellaceae bacterium]
MFPIIFEDNYILAINKPAGLQAEADRWGSPSVELEATAYLEKTYPWKKQLIVGIVHRLDRPVSGVMLLAKTPMALKSLNLQFERRTVRKKYLALVEGELPTASGELVDWLGKDQSERRAVVSSRQDKQARECRLLFQVLETGKDGKSLVEVELLTGRYHQIRAQLAAIGCPIMGDGKYGSTLDGGGMICLHAHSLSVEHPKTGAPLLLEAPLPAEGIWKTD